MFLLVVYVNGLFEVEGIQVEWLVLLCSWVQVIEVFIFGQVNVIYLLLLMIVWVCYGSKVLVKVVVWNYVGGLGFMVVLEIVDVCQFGGKSVVILFWYLIYNVVLQ